MIAIALFTKIAVEIKKKARKQLGDFFFDECIIIPIITLFMYKTTTVAAVLYILFNILFLKSK